MFFQHYIYGRLCLVMKTVSQVECSFLALLTADMHLLGLPSRREPEGLRTAAQRGEKLLTKQHLSMVGTVWGFSTAAWPLEIKAQYVRKYPRKCRHSQLSLDRSTQLLAILLLSLDVAFCCAAAWGYTHTSIHKQHKVCQCSARQEMPVLCGIK